MMTEEYALLLFDLDGTLTEYKIGAILPGVREWFADYSDQPCAIVSNQGGVGLRHWMESEHFGDPDSYPTEDQVRATIERVIAELKSDMDYNVCFAYCTSKGKWAPTPDDRENRVEWQHDWRKPQPGMLLDFINRFGVEVEDVLMVGDWPEDEDAAAAAGCHFQWAHTFFGRPADTA